MKNFIFDLYGTLADIRTDEFSPDFWKRMTPYFRSRSEKDIDFEAEFNSLMVKYTADNERETDIAAVLYMLFKMAGVNYTKTEIYAIGRELREASTQKLRLYPCTMEALTDLKSQGKKLYLLTNAQALFTVPEIDKLGLREIFDGIEISSDYGYRKPSAKFFNYLLDKYGLELSESVYIGNDYENDIKGACNAGLKAIYIRTETSPVDAEPKDDFTDIRHFLNGDHSKLYEYLKSI
ncbi:MAG: HAD family hydrolase [Clostridia bacterium]|nr:HAD family hydrolase [Clostridia bacterium]